MNTSQFQSDRREALRRQLVELPGLAVVVPPARPRPTRRILLTAAAALVGALVVGQISVTAQSRLRAPP